MALYNFTLPLIILDITSSNNWLSSLYIIPIGIKHTTDSRDMHAPQLGYNFYTDNQVKSFNAYLVHKSNLTSLKNSIRDRSLFIAWGGAEDLGGDQMVI